MSELSKVKGINSRQIKLLAEHGISSAEALAMASMNSVSDIRGLGDKTAGINVIGKIIFRSYNY